MRSRGAVHFLRFFSVAIILVVALTAKIPNKFCKCNHKSKPVKQACPYGELRQVVNCLLEDDFTGFQLGDPFLGTECIQSAGQISSFNQYSFHNSIASF